MVTLQIGSGLGRVEYHLARQVRKCWGVDISPSMVKRARRLVPHPNVEFVISNGVNLSAWQDETFNLIYSFLVFQHLPRAQFGRYVKEAAAKLVEGGYLVFQVMVDESDMIASPPESHPYGLRYYSRAEVEETLRTAGLKLQSLTDLEGRADDRVARPTGDVVFCAVKR